MSQGAIRWQLQGIIPLLVLLFCVTGCKTVDDHIADLDTLDPTPAEPTLTQSSVVFDDGQLAHEGLAGLGAADEMTFAQAIRALYHACSFLGHARDNALLQADAAVLIGRLATRIPIPPVDRRLDITENVTNVALEQIQILVESWQEFAIPIEIAALESPDEVVAQEALRHLQDLTDQDFGRDVAAWREWWDTASSAANDDVVAKSREPLDKLGRLRFANASQSRAVLRILSVWLRGYSHPDLEQEARGTVLRVARQAAVFALVEGLRNSTFAQVRADCAEAMSRLRDPAFGSPLIAQLQRERDDHAMSKIIQTLRFYPGRDTIVNVIAAMGVGGPQVALNASRTLESITGERLGDRGRTWMKWWEEKGLVAWP